MTNLKKFNIIWGGELLSSIGSGMTVFALTLYFTKLTHSASYAGFITLAGFAPMVLLVPFGGVCADRYNRLYLMMLGNCFAFIGIAFIYFGLTHTWTFIFIGLTIIGTGNAFLEPAYKAILSELLSPDEFSKASGKMQLANSSKFIFSPILAALLYTVISVPGILFIDLLTFTTTILLTFFVTQTLPKSKHNVHEPFFTYMMEGYQSIKQHTGIIILVLIFTFVAFLIGFIEVLFTPLLLPYYNEKVIGFLIFGVTTGAIISSALISSISFTKRYQTILSLSLAGVGFTYALLGFSVNIIFLLCAGWFFFFCLSFVNMSAEVLIRKTIPNKLQGRAWGFIGCISQIGMLFAYASGGVISDTVLNPLLQPNGLLASSLGQIIGTGQGRGIGLLFILSGSGICLLSFFIQQNKSLQKLEPIHSTS